MKIDIHADDYGLTPNTSNTILAGIEAGKLNSISIMPNMENFSEGVLDWKKKITKDDCIQISVHLNFMEGFCLSPKELLPHLVDEKGLFSISWGSLVKFNFNPFIRTRVKEELKKEIKAQIQRVAIAYDIDLYSNICIDSHQHTHMIPLVLEAIVETIEEEKWKVSYIRITKEIVWPYFKAFVLWEKHELINIVKVIILNSFAIWDKGLFDRLEAKPMILSGVFFSGKMSYERVHSILPLLKKVAQKKGYNLEILFHPGTALLSEMGEEFNHQEANKFYLSEGRQIEYDAMMQLNLESI